MRPLLAAAFVGLPVVDGDGMGRAFPELQMCTFFIYGLPVAPAALCDVRHNIVLFDQVLDAFWLEPLARAVTMVVPEGVSTSVAGGSTIGMTAALSVAWRIRATCRSSNSRAFAATGAKFLRRRPRYPAHRHCSHPRPRMATQKPGAARAPGQSSFISNARWRSF
jgi:hypothetical protein